MKVKELIEQLQKLDQEKNVWVFYDYPFAATELTIDEKKRAGKEAASVYEKEGVKEGDYFFDAC